MKYLALDYGLKRVGVAVSDPEGRMAFPRCTLARDTRDGFFSELLALLERERPDAVVLGLPLHVDGTECLTTRQVRNFAASLKRRMALPLYWIDEALTSRQAESDLREAGLSARAIKQVVDQQAAVRILETFLAQPENRRTPA
ncbi:MAG TPA: Holliday junction resolvase RuvX [Candidatus Mailhella merdigallinarum]|uniref:Putative pre-16S rRNA nuclease n=1 Tax=Candidatus Mailhella merdigallinarum TaxID=2838658 RepID=A0A9D2HC36_9BACT|nr:Holliday junction resolvase RuvX [Desulfovibrionaceae bacterium]HJA07734.1 Holliday junction resolvase RuvX [Candidatus Mailhella merdigallinarum]